MQFGRGGPSALRPRDACHLPVEAIAAGALVDSVARLHHLLNDRVLDGGAAEPEVGAQELGMRCEDHAVIGQAWARGGPLPANGGGQREGPEEKPP